MVSDFSAQVWSSPASILVTPVRPTTRVGVASGAVFPTPSWPEEFRPQQYTVPAGMRAQLCRSPLETSTAGSGCSNGSGDWKYGLHDCGGNPGVGLCPNPSCPACVRVPSKGC